MDGAATAKCTIRSARAAVGLGAPGCSTSVDRTRACREQSAMCCRCRLQLLDSVCRCRPAQSGIVADGGEACAIKGGGQGLDAAQDQQAGSNVREEASVFRWKILTPYRTDAGLAPLSTFKVARGCVKEMKGLGHRQTLDVQCPKAGVRNEVCAVGGAAVYQREIVSATTCSRAGPQSSGAELTSSAPSPSQAQHPKRQSRRVTLDR
jgi:hypothetical protein